VIEKLNKGELNDYYNCIFYIFKDNYQKHIIEDELNDLDYLDYEVYKKFEKRNFLQIMWSIFRTNYDFWSTFFIFEKEDYKIYMIKIISYINTFLFSLDINISFYTDDTMHKIYVDNGDKNNFSDRWHIILLTNVISSVPSILFELLFSSYQKYFIELKKNMDNDEKINQIARKYYRRLLIRIISLCIFSIFFNLFSWYYISCFFAVYLNTQKAILFDVLREFGLNIISCILLSFIYAFIKINFIKCCQVNTSNNCERIKYSIMKVINDFWFLNLLLIVLQIIIAQIFQE
jgi:hypothetical protein